jgi:hypothetical protein
MEWHHIVPVDVTQSAGVAESQTLRLCGDCHREAHSWYMAKVHHSEYDVGLRRFRSKSFLEMVREYQAAFSSFASYKDAIRRQRRRA